jgi:two-component system, OmpR family, phosphate regulon sensor histidine kinase PhoR
VFVIMLLFFRHARIIDYTTLYKRLKEIDQLKDDFIAMASHELRTPLTVIRGYAEELSTIPKLSEEGRSFIRYIDLSARQLDDLVSDMLDVSKIEQNRMEFVAEEIDVLMFANEITKSFQPRVKSKELALLCTGDAAMISVDKKRFRQVLINLIGNAVKYTQKGSVKIRISLRKKNIVEIRVSDTGIGMTAEEQKRLFEKFYRIKNEDTKDIRGSGLGLWLTKALVENMGGTLSVESIKGVGTHFIISFPHA